ncbi:hypothetical protein GCM10010387_18070 [Streptomyces inusitatus]|uniref:Type IV secretion protein Rhs n=1 Tax=Streptomyces inusitatus TaxID=68221 RepID=A0A918PVU7_9ACTN|nr:DUF6531 domain-containing protein [Streptomyces inusitatus]GGZ24991.1 hypothetical protein GCM10010387_18070 [Streptomyces inusitatus]
MGLGDKFKDVGGAIYDGVRDGVDKGKEIVGEGVDYVTDKAGAALEKVGAEDWADSVEDWGDSTASSLGADVDEQQLGQTNEANELIHGSPGKIEASAKNLRDFQRAFDAVGAGMRKLDSTNWKGEGANAFRDKFSVLPTDWLRAADAFEAAAKALESFAKTVTWAQSQAREAITLHKKGTETSKDAVDAYNKRVDAYNAARNEPNPPAKPEPFTDPGKAERERAKQILKEARRQRDDAAGLAKGAISGALAHAPQEPEGWDRLKIDGLDLAMAQSTEVTHVVGGVVKGTAGLLNFVRSVNPLDAYNLTHPAEYYKNVNMTLAGLASTAANPDRALKNAWDAAKGDPSEFLGRLIPEIVGAKGAGVVRGAVRAGAKGPGGTVPNARGAVQDPAKQSRTKNAVKEDGTDPVDLATGVMFLPQTDIVLPGVLPLVFRRRAASDYRAGRWFGPTWTSTVDQRLEIDSEGIVLVCDDGLLLAYPHPAPGVPVLPSHGPRRPLDRTPDGDYTVTDPDTGRVHRFTTRHDDLALLTQIEDRNGNWITFAYDDETDAPVEIVHHGGYHLTLTTEQGRVTALHLANAGQRLLDYGYTDGHLTEVTNSSGLPLRFSYDEHGRITSWTDTNDSRYDYVYDDQNRCVDEGGTAGHLAVRLEYGFDRATGLRTTTVTDTRGAVRRYLVNAAHQIVAETDALGAVTRYERDRYNRLLSRTDPMGHTTRYTYDDAGRMTGVIRPDGRQLSAEYNELGLPVRVRSASGMLTRQTYDSRGNRTAITDPSGATRTFTYDASGHLSGVTDPLGHFTLLRCDRAGLPIEVIDPLGAVTRHERDAFGRPVAITDPLGSVTRMEWTPEGRIARRTAADGTEQSWVYDGEGNCVSSTDATGAVTRFEYTHFDLLAARTGPDQVRYTFEHDAELRLTQVTNPQGLTWTYTYDPAGRLTAETDFDGRTLTYAHDPAGRLIARTDALGQTIRYERDALDRITTKDADGAISTFSYDIFDQLAEATGSDTALTRLRDRYGRLISETVNGRTLTYGYDVLGRRVSRTTPSGVVSTWAFDPAGRRTALTASGRTLTFERDAAGREIARHIGDTLTLASAFDPLGRLTDQHLTTAGGRSLQRRGYTYRADGHLTGLTDQLTGTQTFDLDTTGRVTAVHAAGWTETYAYDEAGNQTDASWPISHPGQEATGPRVYTGTTLTRAGAVRYQYDALGRAIIRRKPRLSRKPDTWHYTWDAENLTAVIPPDGTQWRYHYDPLGRRTAKQHLAADGHTILEQTTFTWDGATLCEQTTTSGTLPNPVTLTWDHDGLRPLAQTERITAAADPQQTIDERFFVIVTDLIGTPTELLTEAGESAWRNQASLWGITTWNVNAAAYTPIRFPGQYADPETGLHYNVHRYYDPESARYLSPDPLRLAPAPNPSTYVHNPHVVSDPLGLSPCPNGGSWDPDEAPYIYRGISFSDGSAPQHWQTMYQNALSGRAEPLGGHSDVQRHVGGDEGTWSVFTSWTTDLEDVARESSQYGNGPGVVLRIPNGDGTGYSRVPGVSYPYDESEVTLLGTVQGAEISIAGGPWHRP